MDVSNENCAGGDWLIRASAMRRMRTLLEYKHFLSGKCSYHETCTHIYVRLSCDYYLFKLKAHDRTVNISQFQS